MIRALSQIWLKVKYSMFISTFSYFRLAHTSISYQNYLAFCILILTFLSAPPSLSLPPLSTPPHPRTTLLLNMCMIPALEVRFHLGRSCYHLIDLFEWQNKTSGKYLLFRGIVLHVISQWSVERHHLVPSIFINELCFQLSHYTLLESSLVLFSLFYLWSAWVSL